jgi:hypothetical protein
MSDQMAGAVDARDRAGGDKSFPGRLQNAAVDAAGLQIKKRQVYRTGKTGIPQGAGNGMVPGRIEVFQGDNIKTKLGLEAVPDKIVKILFVGMDIAQGEIDKHDCHTSTLWVVARGS